MVDLPERFKERMRELLGEEYEDFAASYEKERVQGLRFNSLKTGDAQGKIPSSFSLEKIPWAKEGYYYSGAERPGKHPLHEAGLYYIQEPSAMAVVELLDPQPGERVLDLCAAPGGKSSHIASRLMGDGFLLSNEIHPGRAKILSQNMERMGVTNAVVSNEDSVRLAARFREFFDRIAVDAPCSGEGMFRKDEEARRQWSEEHVKMCASRQREILDNAASMLKPGGRLVYSTCTFAPEENEGTIRSFLMRHSEFSLEQVPAYPGFSKGKPEWALYGEEQGEMPASLHLERTFRIMPHRLEGEGHFIAVLKKEEGAGEVRALRSPVYLDKKKQKAVWKETEGFLTELLTEPQIFSDRPEYILFGEQLYLLPPEMPDMAGLKILRPGLHIGTLKKNRLEPSHALALSLKPHQVRGWYQLPSDSEDAVRYLKGEALTCYPEYLFGKEKGWILMCTDGFSLGWAKLTGTVLKNHYPKGLRWM